MLISKIEDAFIENRSQIRKFISKSSEVFFHHKPRKGLKYYFLCVPANLHKRKQKRIMSPLCSSVCTSTRLSARMFVLFNYRADLNRPWRDDP